MKFGQNWYKKFTLPNFTQYLDNRVKKGQKEVFPLFFHDFTRNSPYVFCVPLDHAKLDTTTALQDCSPKSHI